MDFIILSIMYLIMDMFSPQEQTKGNGSSNGSSNGFFFIFGEDIGVNQLDANQVDQTDDPYLNSEYDDGVDW